LVSNRTQASGAMRRDPTLFISDGVFNVWLHMFAGKYKKES
jgi:hypothetical protein